ncbi:MAG: fumarylacetoacetate hydrolase family protein [Pseudomonadota bacterium]
MKHPFVIPVPAVPSVPVADEQARFPIHRIYCVGRNYAEHAKEMGSTVDRETPTFFMKPADAAWPRAEVPFPPGTTNLHHEVELVVALAAGGRDLDPARALGCVFGYAIGLDLTRRDLQAAAKAKGNPWDTAKGFDASAPVGAIVPAATLGHPAAGELALKVNGIERQRADIATMIFGVPELIAALSRLFQLRPGDHVFTGTPAGGGPLVVGDVFEATFPGLPVLRGTIR